MYAQREKPKEKKKQVTVVVNQTKKSPRLGEDYLAHHSNELGQRQDKEQISHAAARYCQPSPSTIQRMDDDKDKEQTSENLDNLQLSLELLGMTPGVGMIADAANVGISLFRGNYADALINLAAMVPLVGQGVTGGKLAAKAASSTMDVLGTAKAKTSQIAGARFHEIVSSINGKVVDNYSILDNGPLTAGARTRSELNDSLAATFSGGRYADIELTDNLVVYRAWHPDQAREFGAFWSLEKPAGSLQTRIDSALLPEWGKLRSNPVHSQQATQYTEATIPKGTRIYIGEVGSQASPWVGSGSQLLLKDGNVLPEWKTGGGLLK